MNEHDFDPMFDQFYSRVAAAEKQAEDAEGKSRKDELSGIRDYTDLIALEDDFWKRYMHVSELDDDLTKRLLEMLKIEKKSSEVTIDNIRELTTLSRRVGISLTTILGAIRRLADKKNEFFEDQKVEISRLREFEEAFYELGGNPVDKDEDVDEDPLSADEFFAPDDSELEGEEE